MSLQITDDPQAYCTLCRQFTYRILWRAEKHYVAGAQFELRSHCHRAFFGWSYAKFRMTPGDITFRWKFKPSVSELSQNRERILFRARLPYGIRKGEPAEIEMTVIPPIWAGIDNTLSVWTIDVPNNFDASRSAVKEEGSECALAVSAGPVERLSVYCRSTPDHEGKVRTVVVPEDRFGNPGRFEQPTVCQLTWNGSQKELCLRGPEILYLSAPTGVGRASIAVPMSCLAPCENIANGRREGDRLVVTGNPVWTNGPDGMKAAFGEFHWHTDFSGDGQRPIREALRCARDALNMDFAAPGDHNPRGDKWEGTAAALEEYNRSDEFVTFFGWENGSDRGHENYYFTRSDHPLVCGGSAGIDRGRPDQCAERLRELYRKNDFIAIPHHTNSVAETRKIEDDSPCWHPYPWTTPEDYIRLVEIFQVRGNQERNVYQDAWRGWHQNHGASVQDALALGHKLGFVGGTDNHCGWPGRAFAGFEGGGIHPPKSVILTGLWTPRLERQSVFDSLKSRHTWAVWDTRALVHFKVNTAAAGDELTVARGTELTASIRLSAEDALQTVELVSEGKVVWQKSFTKLDVELEVQLGRAARTTHYYLRALQRNGGLIYASPIFVAVTGNDTEPKNLNL